MRISALFIFFFQVLVIQSQDRPFITTWKTDNPGNSCDACITIGTQSDRYEYDYEVDWDMDGVYDEQGLTGNVTHEFGTSGVYTIAIKGAFPSFLVRNGGDHEKILAVDQWGDLQWSSFERAFSACINFNVEAADVPDLRDVKSMSFAFNNAFSLTKGLENWDVSNVTDMSSLFSSANSFNQDLSEWDVSSVTDMTSMFDNAYFFNGDLSEWDVSAVKDMSGMFFVAISFNQDLSNWDVSSVIDMTNMFQITDFNQDLSDWNVSSVVNMSGMFSNASAFNQNLSNWDVSAVTNMSRMFFQASSFTESIKKWNVANVESMRYMFNSASSFVEDISNWDVSSVIDMSEMFDGASSFNHDLSYWEISAVTNMEAMLDDCGMTPENYEQTLEGWATNPSTPNNLDLGSLNLIYCDETGRNQLLDKGWTFFGDIKADEEDCVSSADDVSYVPQPYLYPVPTQNELRIANLSTTVTYILYDQLGRQIDHGTYFPDSALNIQHLDAGIYVLKIVSEENQFPFLFTKTK